MIEKIISGGQSGANQAGWRAAKAYGVSSGGCMPTGFMTEEGPHPEFAEKYGATELPANSDRDRTEHNARAADATLWFGDTTSQGARETIGACLRIGKPCLPIDPGASFEPSHVVSWIVNNRVRTLNIAGSTERDDPGIGDRVERFLGEILLHLGQKQS